MGKSSNPLALGRKRLLASHSDFEFLAGEFIGLKVKVVRSSGKDFQGLEGRIIDETKNTFVLKTSKGIKTIPKNGCLLFFPESGVKADGSILVSRPEDRTKKIVRLSSRIN